MSILIKDPKSKNIHLDIPTPDGPVRLSSRTSNKEAAKMIAAKLQMFAKENKGKKVTKVKILHLAAMLAKVVNTECTEPIPLDEVLLPLAELSATSKSDRDIKRLVVTRFVEFMKQKGLGKLDQWDVEPGHVAGFLKADKEANKLSPRSVRNHGQALGAVFEVAYLHGLAPSNVVRTFGWRIALPCG